jgi:hypothetical protein
VTHATVTSSHRPDSDLRFSLPLARLLLEEVVLNALSLSCRCVDGKPRVIVGFWMKEELRGDVRPKSPFVLTVCSVNDTQKAQDTQQCKIGVFERSVWPVCYL